MYDHPHWGLLNSEDVWHKFILFQLTKWIVVFKERSVEGNGVDLKRANAGLLEVVVDSTKGLEAKGANLGKKSNCWQSFDKIQRYKIQNGGRFHHNTDQDGLTLARSSGGASSTSCPLKKAANSVRGRSTWTSLLASLCQSRPK